MPSDLTESDVEEIVLSWFRELGYTILHGPEIGLGEAGAERSDYSDPLLLDRLKAALSRLNPSLPPETLDDAFRKLTRVEFPSLVQRNRHFHRLLTEGVPVEYRADGRIVPDTARIVDFDSSDRNDWVAVNQFTVVENHHNRRPDVGFHDLDPPVSRC